MEKLSNMRHMLPEFVICLAGEYVVLAPRTVGTAKTVLGCYQGGEPLGLQDGTRKQHCCWSRDAHLERQLWSKVYKFSELWALLGWAVPWNLHL